MIERPNRPLKQRQSQQNVCMKSVKTITQYNVGDYLPTQQSSQSRSIVQIHRMRDKMTTEPIERSNQNEQLLRKVVLLQQEKLVLKVELERSKRDLMLSEQKLKQKEIQLNQAEKKEQQTWNKLKELQKKRQPRVLLERNTVYIQILPKFKQSYQVSVQTDPTIQQYSLDKQTKNISAQPSSDMQHIYQKMQSLKIGRRTTKPEVIATHPTFTTNFKAERPRAFTSNWSAYTKDKQNIMRNSNLIEKKTVQKLDRVKSQNLQLYLMPLQQGERLLAAYMEDSYF